MASPRKIVVTAATAADEPILWRMLTFAASMGDGEDDQLARAQADPYLRSYGQNWCQQPGDVGVVAREQSRRAIGAAWLRLAGRPDRLRVAEPSLPELAMGVVPEARGQGVGSRLLRELIRQAAPLHPAMVLSVRADNPARRFYVRHGFVEVGTMTNRVGGTSIVMKLDLHRIPTSGA